MESLCKAMLKKKRRRLLAVMLAVVLAVVFPLPDMQGMGEAQAAGRTQEIANVVVFVKYQDDTRDIYNAVNNLATPARSNWQELKNMYDLDQDSFSNYISAITEGTVHVTNYFPQERTDRKGVQTLVIPRGDGQGYIVGEVVKAITAGKISMDTTNNKVDNREKGILDNLTIIIQGDKTDWGEAAYKARYSGQGSLNGIRILDYNVLPSASLVSENASLSYRSRQGVIAHEFLHTMGLPDLYRDAQNSGTPVGYWDIMASVSGALQYPLSYLRAREGWIPMKTITQSGQYTLTVASGTGGNKVFALRTPLSDSELICLEYRRKGTDPNGFEYSLPGSGLLMYRVDNKVEGLSNHAGENYIYVYRPGVTHPEAGTDAAGVNNAALDVTKGQTGYGTTDLSADFSRNTLYYSDGSNSGIQISGLKLSSDQTKLTFTVTFADYSNTGVWDDLGEEINGQFGEVPDICIDPATGTLYAAYAEEIPGSDVGATRIRVKSWNGTAWQQVGQTIANARTPSLAVCAGEVYLSYYRSTDHAAVYCKLGGGKWGQIGAYASQYPRSMQFVVDGNDIYGAYQGTCSAGVRMVIRNIKSGATVTDSLTTAIDFSDPRLVKTGNSFYMVCSEFPGFQSSTSTQIREYNMSTGKWSTKYTIASAFTNEHSMVKQGQKIYVFAGSSEESSYMTVFDGNSWSTKPIVSINHFSNASMDVVNGEIYLAFYDTDLGRGRLLKGTGTVLEECGDRLGSGLDYLEICSYGDTLYAATRAVNTGSMVVRTKSLSQGGTGTPEQTPHMLTLTPPAGYGDNTIYVDGVEYEARKNGGSYQVRLPDTSGKTAVMYSYNDKNIPVGMYVWKLEWQGNVCRAVPMPGLQDMLSYHGFSIRVQSPAGIRFKSGIEESLKQRLTTAGVDGYVLKEYGTLLMLNENREKYPFVKDGTKVKGGRAYWIENGKVNDKVFETVAGRNRFTSVFTGQPASMYAKDFAFRAYAVLDCGGDEIIIYGPPVYRSIYTVAKQVQAKGEFKVGSNGYRYVQAIIDTVEGR